MQSLEYSTIASFVMIKDQGNVWVICNPNGYDPKWLLLSGKTNVYLGQEMTGGSDFV